MSARISRFFVELIVLTTVLPCSAQHIAPIAPKKRTPTNTPAAQLERYSTALLKNSDVTVRRLNIPQQSEAPIAAKTHDYLLISIGKNSITVKGAGNAFDLPLGPGDMQVIDGGWPHALVNIADTEAELFIIEPARNIGPKAAICGLGAKTCSEHRFGETAQGTYNQYVQFETDTTKLIRLTLAPGVTTHLHDDKTKHLIVGLTPFRGHNDSESFDLKAGDMRWIPAGFQELGNDGAAEARVLIMELK